MLSGQFEVGNLSSYSTYLLLIFNVYCFKVTDNTWSPNNKTTFDQFKSQLFSLVFYCVLLELIFKFKFYIKVA